MIQARTSRLTKILIVMAATFALAVLVAGCGDKPAETPVASGDTAQGSLPVAQSALSTMAPDAKLLLVQTATSVIDTAPPVWAYLFGSPETDKTYVVYVSDGAVMSAAEYGEAGLGAEEWPKVPGTEDWKIDSDAAYDSALAESGLSGTSAYSMGFTTYIPSTEGTAGGEAFTWYVSLEPKVSGETTATVQVNATTGKAKLDN